MGVSLRPLRSDDAAQVRAWRNAPQVAAHMYSDHEVSGAEHRRWLAAALSAEDRRYWIIRLDGASVGLANLARIDTHNRRCEWAYYLGEPETRGRGVGAAVEFIVLDEVFGAMGLNRLACEVFVENEAVWSLHESFGFRREAHLRQHVLKGGRFRDVYGLAMLAEDWARLRPAAAARLQAKGHDLATLRIGED